MRECLIPLILVVWVGELVARDIVSVPPKNDGCKTNIRVNGELMEINLDRKELMTPKPR